MQFSPDFHFCIRTKIEAIHKLKVFFCDEKKEKLENNINERGKKIYHSALELTCNDLNAVLSDVITRVNSLVQQATYKAKPRVVLIKVINMFKAMKLVKCDDVRK